MFFSIYDNPGSMWGVYNLASQLKATFKSMEKLSSGLAINWAADDPAGLVISEQLRAQTASLNQEIENVSNLINKYETASSTVSTLRTQLTELRTLAVGASNTALNSEEAQQAYDVAAGSLVTTYNQIVQNAEYNGSKLFDGSENSLAEIPTLEGVDLSSAEAASTSIAAIDEATAGLDAVQVDLGATQKNELEARLRSLQVTRQNLIASESQIRDTDYATEYANYMVHLLTAQATMAMLAHSFEVSNLVLEMVRPQSSLYINRD